MIRTVGVRLAAMILGLGLAASGRADAAFTITFAQVGNNVVTSGVGSINLNGLSQPTSAFTAAGVSASQGFLVVGPDSFYTGTFYQVSFLNQTGFGTGTLTFLTNGGSGPNLGFSLSNGQVRVYPGYTSGTVINNSSTFTNQTFASMGLTAGTYTYAYTAIGSSTVIDTFTVIIPAAPTVPEPASLAMLGLGLAGVVAFARTRRRA